MDFELSSYEFDSSDRPRLFFSDANLFIFGSQQSLGHYTTYIYIKICVFFSIRTERLMCRWLLTCRLLSLATFDASANLNPSGTANLLAHISIMSSCFLFTHPMPERCGHTRQQRRRATKWILFLSAVRPPRENNPERNY